jgi:hypothetical protein
MSRALEVSRRKILRDLAVIPFTAAVAAALTKAVASAEEPLLLDNREPLLLTDQDGSFIVEFLASIPEGWTIGDVIKVLQSIGPR